MQCCKCVTKIDLGRDQERKEEKVFDDLHRRKSLNQGVFLLADGNKDCTDMS